jgi:two-component system sensor histidine kinase AgrC
MDAMKTQIELIEQEYRADLASMEQIRKMRHDLKHHLAVLSALLEENDVAGAMTYIAELSGELPRKPLNGKNLVVESFLGKYRALCECHGIAFASDILFDEEVLPDKTRLGLILGNALQNAYEAALTAPEGLRYLRADGQQIQNNLLLMVENGYDGCLNPDYRTTKTGVLHGYGLPSIRKAAKDMGGFVEIEHTKDRFRLTIVLTVSTHLSP